MYSLCVCVCVSHLRASFCFHLPLSFCVYVCVCVCIPLIKRTRHTQFEDFKVATSAANGQIMTQFLGIFMLVSCSKCGAIVKRQLTTKATLPLFLSLSFPFSHSACHAQQKSAKYVLIQVFRVTSTTTRTSVAVSAVRSIGEEDGESSPPKKFLATLIILSV